MFNIILAALIQLSLVAFAAAAPVTVQGHGNAIQYGTGGGIVGFIVLILDVITILEVLKSSRPGSHKILWSLVIFFLPVIGIIIYYLFSNRDQYKSGGGYEAIPETKLKQKGAVCKYRYCGKHRRVGKGIHKD